MIPFSYTEKSFYDTPDSVVFDPKYAYMTSSGRTWCRFMASVMAASALSFMVSYSQVRRGNRFFHICLIFIHGVSAYTYLILSYGHGLMRVPAHYALARGLPVPVPGIDEYFERQVSVARYIDWSITTPVCLNLPLSDSMSFNAFVRLSSHVCFSRLEHPQLSLVPQSF